jgi:NaMN:DMB phosphoribosyltransferase
MSLYLVVTQTTLAMSILWGLTGSLDTRLVADGKASDVAFDTGDNSKVVAGISIQGTINSKPFSVVRRKGARKSELYFSVVRADVGSAVN